MKYLIQICSLLALVGLSLLAYQILSTGMSDAFNTVHENRWKFERDRFFGNSCKMLEDMVSIEEGAVAISLSKSGVGDTLPYISGGLVSLESYKNGIFKFRTKQRMAAGTISSFILSSPWDPIAGQDMISISFLGSAENKVFLDTKQFRLLSDQLIPTEVSYEHEFSNSTTHQYHEYEIKWLDQQVEFHIDGEMIFVTDKIGFNKPMNIKLIQWAANKTESSELFNWLGPVDEESLPSKIYVDQLTVKPIHLFEQLKCPFKF